MTDSTSSRWVSARAVRASWVRLRAAWTATPQALRRRWAIALGLGFLVAAAALAGLTLAAKAYAEPALAAWDTQQLRRLTTPGPFSFARAVSFQAWGSSAVLLPLLLLGGYLALRHGRPFRALTLVAAYAGAKLLANVGWLLWDRARPDLVAGGIAAPALNSFPSGHALNASAVVGLLAVWWIQASRSWIERVLVGFGAALVIAVATFARVRLGVHWPSDAIAGLVVGALWLAALVVALRQVEGVPGRVARPA